MFGYASLVPDGAGGRRGRGRADRASGAALGVAHDNRRVIPGYKTYFSRDDGSRPEVYVAFFDLEVADGMTVAGLALPVDDERLEALDAREAQLRARGRDRPGRRACRGRVWTYLGPRRQPRPAGARAGRGHRGGVQGLPREGRAAPSAPAARRPARVRAHHRDPRDPSRWTWTAATCRRPGPRERAPPGTTWSAPPTAPTCRCGASWPPSAAGPCWTWAPAPAAWRSTWRPAATRWWPWTSSPTWWPPAPSAPRRARCR